MDPRHDTATTRRELFRTTGVAIAGLGLAPLLPAAPAANAAAPPATRPVSRPAAVPPLDRFPRMVQEYFVRRVREVEAAANTARAVLATREDALRYVAVVREKARQCFGPFPEKTPLNPRTTGKVDRDVYTIENVIFESRPGFLVTANLYVPKGRAFPLPGVVGTCGHSANGKAYETYQSFAQGLARQGYVTLIFDPIGQGERLQYLDPGSLKSRVGDGVAEHLLCGNQQFLVGEFFGAWRAWDGIRALDYLLSRPEVDPKHVGVTGNSGGGTMTTWLCALDDRWTMAAPGCFVSTFRRDLENELPQDTEQCPPRALALGLDHSDFLAAMAPKPIIILSQEKDYFDTRGAAEAYDRLKRLYTLLGAPENISLHVGPRPHGFWVENRQAMYRWFNRFTKVADAQDEPKLQIEDEQTLRCTPDGQVAPLKSRTVFSFTRQTSQRLGESRKPLDRDSLKAAVASILKLPERRTTPPDYRILRPLRPRGYPKKNCTTYAVETEPGIQALVHALSDEPIYSRPPAGKDPRATLYVAHQSADLELRDEPLVRELIGSEAADVPFYAVDLRGIGDSRPDTCGGPDQFLAPYGSDYFYAIYAIMLDYPYAGQKTHDLLRVLDFLAAHGRTQVHLTARGWGTLPATFAALLSPHAARVTLKNTPTSYAAIAQAENYTWPLSTFIPGVLGRFDLPDCYRALEAKSLKQIEPWGAAGA
ncbi:MAG TPA: acetylxylan esterase [Tepidisphaeraceae bacterium]